MVRHALVCGIALGLAACGAGRQSPPESFHDRLLLLAWNYPDSGVTRLLVQLHDDETEPGSIEHLVAADEAEVEAVATLRSPNQTVSLTGVYDHDGDYFWFNHRSGSDSLKILGNVRPRRPPSPVVASLIFSGPPEGNGSVYGVRDTTGMAVFFCASYTLVGAPVSRSFGLIVTDSLVIGLGGDLPLPFRGMARADSLILADGVLRGRLSPDRSTAAGTVELAGHTGQWSGRRCDVASR